MRKLALALVILVFCGVSIGRLCAAEEAEDGGVAGFSLKIGTLGYGVDFTLGLASEINTRLGLNMFSYEPDVGDDEEDEGPEDIEVELDWQTIPILLDWHPWAENFRFSLGAVVNNNEVVLTADIGEEVEINDRSYVISDLQGKVTFDPVAPYLGIGWGNARRAGPVKFAFDLGVMFQGAPQVELTATAASAGQQTQLQADLDAEKAELEDDLDAFTMYPVISFGISFVF